MNVEIRNSSLDKAFNSGRDAALNALREDPVHPIFLMDEVCNSDTDSAYAMGWNSLYGSEENRTRQETKMPLDPEQIQTALFGG